MARGTGPGRVGRLAELRTGCDPEETFLAPRFLAREERGVADRDTEADLLDRAVPGEDPRDFVDVRDAIYPRLPTPRVKTQ